MNGPIVWREGGVPQSAIFGDVYYSLHDGLAESRHVFLHGNGLPERWEQKPDFVIAEFGFGTGLNFCMTAAEWRARGCAGRLHYISFERYPLRADEITRALSVWGELDEESSRLAARLPVPAGGFHRVSFDEWKLTLTLVYGDAREMLEELEARVDAWYLDGFAPAKNPELWEESLFRRAAHLSNTGATAATFSAARAAKDSLAAGGFAVEKCVGFGRKREMLRAALPGRPPPAAARPERAVVIGGGIAGASAADALARRGAKVLLLESGRFLAEQASGNPLGIIMPQPAAGPNARSRLADCAYQYSLRLLNELSKSDNRIFAAPGVLRLSAADSIRNVAEHFERFGFDPFHVRLVSADEAGELAGTRCSLGGLFFPSAGWVKPQPFCRALAARCPEAVQVRTDSCAAAVRRRGGIWEVLDAAGSALARSEVVVVAAGISASAFFPTVPLEAVRGQLAFVPATSVSRALRIPVCHRGYITPAIDGLHVVGATFDRGDTDMSLRPEQHEMLLNRTAEHLPLLRFDAAPARGRTSFRAQTPDKLPAAGAAAIEAVLREQFSSRAPKKRPSAYPKSAFESGLYLSVGHGSHGLSTAPLIAEQIAADVYKEPLPLPRSIADALSPARFFLRELRRSVHAA